MRMRFTHTLVFNRAEGAQNFMDYMQNLVKDFNATVISDPRAEGSALQISDAWYQAARDHMLRFEFERNTQ